MNSRYHLLTKTIALILPILAFVLVLKLTAPGPVDAQGIPSAFFTNSGFKAVSTPTLTITSASAVILGTIPAGCHYVEVIASSDGDINYGPSTLSTGTEWPYITAGQMKTFSILSTVNPTIYFRARGTVATTTRLGISAY